MTYKGTGIYELSSVTVSHVSWSSNSRMSCKKKYAYYSITYIPLLGREGASLRPCMTMPNIVGGDLQTRLICANSDRCESSKADSMPFRSWYCSSQVHIKNENVALFELLSACSFAYIDLLNDRGDAYSIWTVEPPDHVASALLSSR